MPSSPSGTYRFAHWEIRPQERTLLVRGERAKVGSRAFDVLLVLVQRQGSVVAKRDLMDSAWPSLFVEENNLSVQISALRKLLGQDSIKNVAGQGYQLTDLPLPLSAASHGPTEVALRALLGRDRELAALATLVGTRSLVTLVGPGGVGKTALARTVVDSLETQWPDGVHWIDVAPLSDGVQLSQAVSKALGVFAPGAAGSTDDLDRAMAPLRALVALDNCEHLLDAVTALVAHVIRLAPHVHWFATSREPLHCVEESVYRLAPLSVPMLDVTVHQASEYGALALFCERAASADRQFVLSAANIGLCADLCGQLDGLPLAIEMAAARIATLGMNGVLDQIKERLRLRSSARGAPSRHNTLLQTYEWSYGLLGETEKVVFRRLAPFVGGFTTHLAQALCASVTGPEHLAAWEALDALSALIDKSLVQRQPGGRLFLLESARDFARLQLESTQELESARHGHAQVVAEWFAFAQQELDLGRDVDWSAKYLPERRNVGAALEWACTSDDADLLARLTSAMAQLDTFVHIHAEIVRYPLPIDTLARAALPLRARAYLELGWAHFLDGSRETGTGLCLRALADFRSVDDAEGTYATLARLIRLYHGRPGLESRARLMWNELKQIDEARVSLRTKLACHSTIALLYEGTRTVQRLEDLERMARRSGLDAQAAVCRLNITDELLLEGRYEEVVKQATRMLEAGEPMLRVRAIMYYNRAHALVRLGRIAEARSSAQAMLRTLPGYAYLVMDLFSSVALQEGRSEDAALLAGRSARTKQERDLHQDASEIPLIAETLQRLKEELGECRAEILIQQGGAMSTSDVLQLAWGDHAT
jgi:predicted ATPase